MWGGHLVVLGNPTLVPGLLAQSVGGQDQGGLGSSMGSSWGGWGAVIVPWGSHLEQELLPWHSQQCWGPWGPCSAPVQGGLRSGAGSEAVNGACHPSPS